MNININTLKTFYPKLQTCSQDKVLYRVTFGYKSNLSGDKIFPVTYQNFNENFLEGINKINPGDLVIYKSKKKNDPSHGKNAKVIKVMKEYRLGKVKKTFYEIEFVNPIISPNNEIINKKKVFAFNLERTQKNVEYFICQSTFLPNNLKNNNWKTYFNLDDTNKPTYPKIERLNDDIKNVLNNDIENMVKVGFLLGKKGQRPKIYKKDKKFYISFLMPKNSIPGQQITVPVTDGNNIKNIIVKIPKEQNGIVPGINQYIKNVEVERELNTHIYDTLKSMSSNKDIDTEFKPTFIKGSEYVGSKKQIDLDKLVKPSDEQKYVITSANIIKQNNDNFSFKKIDLFNTNENQLVYDLYVLVNLKLKLKLKGPDKIEEDNIIKKAQRYGTEIIMNSSQNCDEVKKRVSEAGSKILGALVKRGGGGCLSRRCRRDTPDNMEVMIQTGQRNALDSFFEAAFQEGERRRLQEELRTVLRGEKSRQRQLPSTLKLKRTQGGKRRRKTRKKRGRKKKTRKKRGGARKPIFHPGNIIVQLPDIRIKWRVKKYTKDDPIPIFEQYEPDIEIIKNYVEEGEENTPVLVNSHILSANNWVRIEMPEAGTGSTQSGGKKMRKSRKRRRKKYK